MSAIAGDVPPGRPEGSRMTLRTYTVRSDGSRTPVRMRTVFSNEASPLGLGSSFPPCECPRHKAPREPGERMRDNVAKR